MNTHLGRRHSRFSPLLGTLALLFFAVPCAFGQDLTWWGYPGAKDVLPDDPSSTIQVVGSGVRLAGLRADGTVWSLGDHDEPSVRELTDVVQIAGNDVGHIALKADGTITTWGYMVYPPPENLANIRQVEYRGSNGMALQKDGKVLMWGDPIKVRSMPSGLANVKQVALTSNHCLALKKDGTVVAWGSDPTFGYTKVPAGLAGVVQVQGTARSSVALKADGTVVTWGYRYKNQPASLNGVVQISASDYLVLAVKEDGSVVAWGDEYANSPTAVPVSLGKVGRVCACEGVGIALGTVGVNVPKWSHADSRVTGTVVLPVAPGAGGAYVNLSSGPALNVPSRVFVKAGQHMATFKANVVTPDEDTDTVVAAAYGVGSATTSIDIYGKAPVLTVNLPKVVGGSTDAALGTIRFSRAPKTAATVRLTSDSDAVSVPTTVQVAAGAQYTDFPIAHMATAYDKPVVVSLQQGGEVKSTARFILTALKAIPSTTKANVYGAVATTIDGAVTLNAKCATDTVVGLSTNRSDFLTLPVKVTVKAGETTATFQMQAAAITSVSIAEITATVGKQKKTTKLTVMSTPEIKSIGFDDGLFVGNSHLGPNFIRFSQKALHDEVVTISSDNPLITPLESQVALKKGSNVAYFNLQAADISAEATAHITATCGVDSLTSAKVVAEPLVPTALRVQPSAKSGKSVACSVRFGRLVYVASKVEVWTSSPDATAPSEVTVRKGGSSVGFDIITQPVTQRTEVTIYARRNGVTVSAVLVLLP